MKVSRVIFTNIIVLILFLASSYLYFVYKNNLDSDKPSTEEIQHALDRSIDWVLKNQDKLIQINNPTLWWFLDESAYLTNNNELASLVRKYRNNVLDRNSVWTGYFVKTPPFTYMPGTLNFMEKYQKFFVYGLTCDSDLGEEEEIQEQLKINFCNWTPYYSSCITHQLMAIRLLQIKKCDDQNLYKQLSDEIVKNIEKRLMWDPRVGDVYIQRALMLVESGNKDKVKHVWIKNILNEQLEDGGWASFDKILPLYNDKYIGFSYKFIDIKTPISSFHSTAQAIHLLSLIYSKNI